MEKDIFEIGLKTIHKNLFHRVQGYGRRRYKAEYIKYLTYSQASCDETINHILSINRLYPEIVEFLDMDKEYEILGKKINNYIQYVEKNWKP